MIGMLCQYMMKAISLLQMAAPVTCHAGMSPLLDLSSLYLFPSFGRRIIFDQPLIVIQYAENEVSF